MTTQTPAGWFPDPEDPTQQRYWDGNTWTEHRAPAPTPAPAWQPPVTHQQQPQRAMYTGPTDPNSVNERGNGLWWKIGLGVLAFLFVVGTIFGSDDTEPAAQSFTDTTSESDDSAAGSSTQTETTEEEPAEPEPEPVGPYGKQPADQVRFLDAVTTAQDAEANADNDLQKGAALSTRNKALCNIVGAGRVTNWTGTVDLIDANGDGLGILEVAIGDDIGVATWNNFLSDAGDNTLIEPGALFDSLLTLEEGQVIRFSGQFVETLGGDECVNDSRLTLGGKLSDPQFIFRFSDVAPAN